MAKPDSADLPPNNAPTYDLPSRVLWVAAAVVLIVAYAVTIVLINKPASEWSWQSYPVARALMHVVVGAIGIGFVVAFVYLFTATIIPERDDLVKERLRQQRWWMIFAYGFMLYAMAMSVLPFFLGTPELHVSHANKIAPIAVMRGCVVDKESGHELRCKTPNGDDGSGSLQWVVTIGGSAEAMGATKTHREKSGGSLVEDGKNAKGNGEESGSKKDNGQVVGYRISGGVVLPLYVIIVAMLGGAISLTRRVPEIQKQLAPGYQPTEEAPRLGATAARENLVFQIVQFISAALLAAVAYQLIESNSVSTSVVIAFAAGFSSESVLLMIRAFFDKVTPTTRGKPAQGSIAGVVYAGDPKVGKKDVEVKLVGDENVKPATSDDLGQFTLASVPVGNVVVEAMADHESYLCKVEVKPCEASTCAIEIA